MKPNGQRLARLERACRRWRALSLFLALALLAVFAWGAEPAPGVIRAQRIELVGPSGAVTAVLESDPAGGQMRLYTHEGREQVRLAVTGAGGELEMTSPAGRELVTLSAGFAAGMVRVESGMLRIGSKNLGSTTILGRTIREGE